MNQDLKQRIPAGIIYVLTIVTCMLAGGLAADMLMVLFFMLCYIEFMSEGGKNPLSPISWSAGVVTFIIAMAISSNYLTVHERFIAYVPWCASVLFFINAFFLVTQSRTLLPFSARWIASIWYLSLPFVLTIIFLRSLPQFNLVLLGSFVLIWLNDTGAYFAGRALGKRKLAPKISPSKTWEGWIGGALLGLVAAIILAQILSVLDLCDWLIIASIVSVSGMLGDLVESSWKRHLGLKDSGTLLKGHGGMLDRLDSFIYAIPFVILFLTFN